MFLTNNNNQKVLSVLIIGLGRVAFGYETIYGDGLIRTHIMSVLEYSRVKNMRAEILGIDPSREARFAVNLRYPELKVYSNFDSLPVIDFDLTIISTPINNLLETAKIVNSQINSKTVLVEKPGVNSLPDAQILNEIMRTEPNWFINYPRRSLQSTKFLADQFAMQAPVFIEIKYSGETINILCHYLDLIEYLLGKFNSLRKVSEYPEIYFGNLGDGKIHVTAERTDIVNKDDHQLKFTCEDKIITYFDCGKGILVNSMQPEPIINYHSELSEMIFHTDFEVIENALYGSKVNLPRGITSSVIQILGSC